MPLSRRHFLKAGAATPLLGAWATPALKQQERAALARISAEELELIKNPLLRPAYFVQHGIEPGALKIKDRIFFDRDRFDDQQLKNIVFVNCIFDGFLAFRNDLINVSFKECQFFGGTFTGKCWQGVRFSKCSAEGPFDIGSGAGDIVFEDCKLKGITQKEMGYGNEIEHYGAARSEESTRLLRCKLTRVITSGEKYLHLIDCEIEDLYANTQSQHGELVVERCQSPSGKMRFGGGGNNYLKISIKDSQLNLVDMTSVSSQIVEIENSSLSLKLGGINAEYESFVARKTKFFGRGLTIPLSKVNTLLLEDCTFDPQSQGLQLYGDVNDIYKPGESKVYWTRSRNVTLRNTVVPKAQLGYMQIGELTLEKSTLADTDLSHSAIGTLRFKEAKLEGLLNLSDATIRQIDNQGVNNAAQVTGKLEANHSVPPPELSGSNRRVSKPSSKP